MGNRIHVVTHPKGFAVKRDGAQRATSLHNTQTQAERAAKQIAKREDLEVVVHAARGGKIRDTDSFGTESRKRDSKH
jgi:hypothetical protein